MEETIHAIVDRLRQGSDVDARWLDRLVRDANAKVHDANRHIAKKRLLPFYLHQRDANTELFQSWQIDDYLDEAIVMLLRAKPRRTASGVATITVLTKPWPCGGNCVFCPSDIQMPKSYMRDEPACQRAQNCWFDPYLQTASRLRVLNDMGHPTDKIELIVLGGTWSDYPEAYQIWFVREMFRALNDYGTPGFEESLSERRKMYEDVSLPPAELQRRVDAGDIDYNGAIASCDIFAEVAPLQVGTFEQLEREHRINESAAHRNVGLVFETRPDLVTEDHLVHLRRLGCTKLQIGIQSLDDAILASNARVTSVKDIERAFELLRKYGFKSHIHFMVNLIGSTPESDRINWLKLMNDPRFIPDEVKLYPCALVANSHLMNEYAAGNWQPYSERELVDLLAYCVTKTRPFTRISRMIRDIPSPDIVAGNKKTNLRQMVERQIEDMHCSSDEMRMREIATSHAEVSELSLESIEYETTNTTEVFLQHVTPDGKLAAFLRLSLPCFDKNGACDGASKEVASKEAASSEIPSAMIREVHVYGTAARIGKNARDANAQHSGLGRQLVSRACCIAAQSGYSSIKVISAIGTRGYYRSLGFEEAGLYQQMDLTDGFGKSLAR